MNADGQAACQCEPDLGQESGCSGLTTKNTMVKYLAAWKELVGPLGAASGAWTGAGRGSRVTMAVGARACAMTSVPKLTRQWLLAVGNFSVLGNKNPRLACKSLDTNGGP